MRQEYYKLLTVKCVKPEITMDGARFWNGQETMDLSIHTRDGRRPAHTTNGSGVMMVLDFLQQYLCISGREQQ